MMRGLGFVPANNNARIFKVFGVRVACDDVTIRMNVPTVAGSFLYRSILMIDCGARSRACS